MLFFSKLLALQLCLFCCIFVRSHWAFDDYDDHFDGIDTVTPQTKQQPHPLPKDKILLKDVKSLTFQRNKRTTSRRTHSIYQLTCVGGTAGCKLFTPDIVECEKLDYDDSKGKYNWRCHAEISDRVVFNHVEVICEGYDYPEDDYILLGSCGLEFTLDYADPHDAHHHSYFHHMDDHEKEMHHERVRAKAAAAAGKTSSTSQKLGSHGMGGYFQFLSALIGNLTSNHLFLTVTLIVLALFSFIMIKLLAGSSSSSASSRSPTKSGRGRRAGPSYGPLASAVLTTKKAC